MTFDVDFDADLDDLYAEFGVEALYQRDGNPDVLLKVITNTKFAQKLDNNRSKAGDVKLTANIQKTDLTNTALTFPKVKDTVLTEKNTFIVTGIHSEDEIEWVLGLHRTGVGSGASVCFMQNGILQDKGILRDSCVLELLNG